MLENQTLGKLSEIPAFRDVLPNKKLVNFAHINSQNIHKVLLKEVAIMTIDAKEVWGRCLLMIRDNINSQSYRTWFEPIVPLKYEGNVLTIQVPSQFFFEWLEENYIDLIRRTIRHVLGVDAQLVYSIVVDNSNGPYTVSIPTGNHNHGTKNPPISLPVQSGKDPINHFVIPGLKKTSIDPQLKPQYTFENFVEGDCNKLARISCYSVATKPGETAFNPVFIHGGVGLGKTHLIQAIGNEVKRFHPNKVVLYVSAERFSSHFIDSVRNGSLTNFLSYYQLVDVLIVDDVQFLGGKDKTQDNFFHVFNHLHQNNKQIILAADCPPKELKNVEERLISRFKWGLTVDLRPPSVETRTQILRQKMYQDGISLPDEIVEFIAHNVSSNIRELEGVVISLLAQSSLQRKEADMSMVKLIVKNLVRQHARELSIETIVNIVCEYFEIASELLKDKTRKREVVQARQVAMYFSKELTNTSLKTIGSYFGGRDHSTVIHAVQTVNDLVDTQKNFRTQVEDIRKKLKILVVQ